jgi:hypothetical protein
MLRRSVQLRADVWGANFGARDKIPAPGRQIPARARQIPCPLAGICLNAPTIEAAKRHSRNAEIPCRIRPGRKFDTQVPTLPTFRRRA